ncbi:MAG: DUF3341 domain-containing protein [Planctomycetota bacterium]|nr:DUF3341 domain-containing protein [Planctomycetota bacterium]
MSKSILCIVPDVLRAEMIVRDLNHAGFSNDDISVLLPDRTGTRDFAHEHGTKAPEGALAGAGAGGAVGGTLGWLAGIGALAIPGLGPFIAAGPILAALSGAAVGAAVGGIAGGLIGMGVPEYEAKQYEGKLKEGNVLVSAHLRGSDDGDTARAIFERHHAESISVTTDAGVPAKSKHAQVS